jgi:ketosteroid isomerase-like protein
MSHALVFAFDPGTAAMSPRRLLLRGSEQRFGLIGLAFLVAACSPGSTDARPAALDPLTDAERTAIADTVRELYRDGSHTFDAAVDCAEIADWLADRASVLFVAQGRLFETGGREDGIMDMCQAIKRNRLSAEEEIQQQVVEVLNRDAALVVTRGVYTVRYRDGRTMVRPQVVTTAWSRGRDGWRMVHLHESWPMAGQPR